MGRRLRSAGNTRSGDAVYVALDLLRAEAPDELVVVGVGHNGAAAQVLALGGRAAGLVLVDGLGGPWLGPVEIDMRLREMRRRILTTPACDVRARPRRGRPPGDDGRRRSRPGIRRPPGRGDASARPR